MTVALFPCRTTDALWARYAVIAQAVIDDPKLLVDRQTIETMTIAQREFQQAFLRECGK